MNLQGRERIGEGGLPVRALKGLRLTYPGLVQPPLFDEGVMRSMTKGNPKDPSLRRSSAGNGGIGDSQNLPN